MSTLNWTSVTPNARKNSLPASSSRCHVHTSARNAASPGPRNSRLRAISCLSLRYEVPVRPPTGTLPFVCMHIVCIYTNRPFNGTCALGGAMRNVWLGLALLPYLAAAGADAWMHERARRVPRLEQWAHAGLATGMTVFLAAVFGRRADGGVGARAAFSAPLAGDEPAFPGGLSRGGRAGASPPSAPPPPLARRWLG